MQLKNLIEASLILGLFTCVQVQAQEKPKAVDPSGTWRWEYEMNNQTLKDSVRLNLGKDGVVTGTYHGRSEKPVEIKNGKMDGDKLSFQFDLEFDGNTLELKFTGKVKNDELDGNVNIARGNEGRDFPWTPKRSVALDDVVGKWQLKIEASSDRVLEPTIAIAKNGDKYVGKYSSPPRIEVDVKELKIVENQWIFIVEAEVDSNKIKATFKGRPYGDKIKGTVDYVLGDQSGTVDFTGKK